MIFIAIGLLSCQKSDPHGYGSHGSPWIQQVNIFPSDQLWKYDSISHIYSFEKSMSMITANVLYNGKVEVFLGDFTDAIKMPLTQDSVTYDYSYQLGWVEIKLASSNGGIPPYPDNLTFMVQTTQW